MTPVFFYVVIAAYMAFVLASAWQFSRRPEPGRVMRAINLTLVPLGVLAALAGVLAARFTSFAQRAGTPSPNRPVAMVPLRLGGGAGRRGGPGPLLDQGLVMLRRAGVSTSARGPHGGHGLARGPEEIRLDQVIGCLEGSGAKSRQPDGAQPGDSRVLAHVTEKAEEAARDVFASHTLADCLRLRQLEPRVFHGIFHAGVAKPRGG